jgi:TonB family protein
MNTSDSNHFQKKALFISLLIAMLIGCFLVFYRILVPAAHAAILPENPADSMLISLPGMAGYQEWPATPEASKNVSKQLPASPVSGKEELNSSDKGLFSNYKANNHKIQPSTVSNSTEEPKTGSTPFMGLFPGKEQAAGDTGTQVNLAGRKVVQLPKAADTKESGIVVVNITVDKEGHVIHAEANGRGTNTASSTLKLKARQAALQAKFSPSETNEIQKGTITYVFEF